MKTIIKYISILAIVLTFTNCEEESNFQDPNIALVPVYSITDIQGTNTPFKINIYKLKSLIIEYSSSVNATSYTSSSYMDTSTDTNYEISVNKMDDGSTVNYLINADKATGVGTMTVDGTTTFDIIIAEEDVYN